ncbi:MAG TPA: cytochrome-c oxidase, cbb3-type subunit III [Allosphingosinicella sp.]|nr:cytochrome-c oxidase, cbb3-type subunit III [Allosphingosinicella sp.]
MADNKRVDEVTGTQTVGHEWDGIEELDTPMPRWWLYTLYATIVWAVVYTILYPAWPLINNATAGVLDWSSRGQLAEELAEEGVRRAPIQAALSRIPIERLPENSPLMRQAVEGGRSAFRVHCVQCHGSGAAGTRGYPNLNDDDWLWGGNIQEIHRTIAFGIRQPDLENTHLSIMPAFGRDGLMEPGQIEDVVSYVRTLSRQEAASASARRGAALFAANCASCHGPDGRGLRQFGAPNLTDAIWLYGGDRDSLRATVTNSRYGVMPAWGGRLDPVTIKMLAAYVHSLGGGEAFVPQAPAPAPANQTGAAAPTPEAENVSP